MGEKLNPAVRRRAACGMFSMRSIVFLATLLLPFHAHGFLFMQVTCGTVLTVGEGTRQGLENYVELSSVHHDLSVPLNIDATSISPGRMSMDALRVVKSLSTSSTRMIAGMARGQVCEQILIEHWIASGDSLRKLWVMELRNVYIVERKEWHTEAAVPQESFGFFPSTLIWTYSREDGSKVETNWDFVTSSVR